MKKITEIPSANGYHKLTMAPIVRKQSRALQKMLQSVKPLQVRANNICKQMSVHYKNLELCLKDLRDVTDQLQQTYQRGDRTVNIGKLDAIADWYGSLKDAFTDWEQIHKIQRNNFFKNIRNMFGTSLYEEQGLEAVSNHPIFRKINPGLVGHC
jgi:uncharacterized protein YukE